jgi:N-methylhydantoinase A
MFRVATDIGGTFTDIAWCEHDPESGTVGAVCGWKTATVPENLTDGVMNAIAGAELSPSDIGFFAHGTTVVINTLTERKGAKAALVTTAGFRDVLEIARGNRPDLFNFCFRKPPPFLPRYLRREIDERTNYKGNIVRPVDEDALARIIEDFRREGVEAIAVSFLHAYANPANEMAALDTIRRLWPDCPVIASHQTTREWREYERTNTAVLSAYVMPRMQAYLGDLEGRLGGGGMNWRAFIMQSNGGVVSVAQARRNPIAMVESGPASGVLGASILARAIGRPNVIALDIGGTTAKCSLVADGRMRITTEYRIEASQFNPGYPIRLPVIDIVEIGTGGGSLAWFDEGGKLHVGPESAGAHPGPVVYGRGGDRPTLTDAHVLSGRIDAGHILGRDGGIDLTPVRRVYEDLGARIGASAGEMARGVLRLAEVDMENALKLVSINRGYDPREFSLVAFGGGGPLHAAALAAALRIPEVIVPAHSAVFSAWGMLLTDVRRDFIRTSPARLDTVDAAELDRRFAELAAEALSDVDGDDALEGAELLFERAADMRYRGQEHTVKVELPAGPIDAAALAEWSERFRAAHDRLYRVRLDVPVELVNLHLVALSIIAKPHLTPRAATGAPLENAATGRRSVDYGEMGRHGARVFRRDRLEPGMTFDGPAIVEERGAVTVVPPGHRVEIDPYDNLLIRTGS